MRHKRKILVGLLAIVVLAQVPYIVRRFQLGSVEDKIRASNAAVKAPTRDSSQYNEYKGVFHVHTTRGGEISDTFNELLNAACDNHLDFVLLTEHYSAAYDTSAMTLNGLYGSTLFVAGNEVDTRTGDRFLVIPGGPDAADFRFRQTPEVLEKIHSDGRMAVIAYPDRFHSWDANFDGDEVYNLNTNSKSISRFWAALDLLWSYPAYPALTFARYFRRPDAEFKRYDEIAAKRRVALFAGLDAHSALGVHVFGDELGHELIGVKVDPYDTMFALARMHVMVDRAKEFNRETLLDAVRNGRFFNGIDVMGNTDGFRFFSENGDAVNIMGDEIPFSGGITLKATSPLPARFVVFKNGEIFYQADQVGNIAVAVTEKAAYRVEVYRDDLGSPFDAMPWIMSNPIYVR